MYSRTYSYGKTDKNNNYKFSDNLKAKVLTGYGNFPELTESDVPVTGSASYKGSGKLVD